MKRLIFLSVFLISTATLFAQENGAYTIFNSKGKKVKYSKMSVQLAHTQIILFG